MVSGPAKGLGVVTGGSGKGFAGAKAGPDKGLSACTGKGLAGIKGAPGSFGASI